jgi:hypothetical protein
MLPVAVKVPCGVAVLVAVTVAVAVLVAVAVGVRVAVAVGVSVALLVDVAVAVRVTLGVLGGGGVAANAAPPPPSSVGQSPQSSVTVSGTVVGEPAVCCRMTKVVCNVPGASDTVNGPVWPAGCPGTSRSAFVVAPKAKDRRLLLGAPGPVWAPIVAWICPTAIG